jgi:hypothetical protein
MEIQKMKKEYLITLAIVVVALYVYDSFIKPKA